MIPFLFFSCISTVYSGKKQTSPQVPAPTVPSTSQESNSHYNNLPDYKTDLKPKRNTLYSELAQELCVSDSHSTSSDTSSCSDSTITINMYNKQANTNISPVSLPSTRPQTPNDEIKWDDSGSTSSGPGDSSETSSPSDSTITINMDNKQANTDVSPTSLPSTRPQTPNDEIDCDEQLQMNLIGLKSRGANID